MTGTYRVANLSESIMRARVGDILGLEAIFYRDFGMNYSHEVWSEENFLYPLPGKWELSKIAFDAADRVIAFWIASHDGARDLRGHRGGTHPDWRRSGVWRDFFERIRADGRRLGLKTMSHTVNAANPNAVPAWTRLGFRILSGDELCAFKVRRHRDADRIVGDTLVTPEGYAYYALYQEI